MGNCCSTNDTTFESVKSARNTEKLIKKSQVSNTQSYSQTKEQNRDTICRKELPPSGTVTEDTLSHIRQYIVPHKPAYSASIDSISVPTNAKNTLSVIYSNSEQICTKSMTDVRIKK